VKNFACIENGIVCNMIVADSLEIAEEISEGFCVEIPEGIRVGVKFLYENGNFIDPTPVDETPLPEDERRALYIAYGLDPDNPPPAPFPPSVKG